MSFIVLSPRDPTSMSYMKKVLVEKYVKVGLIS